MRQIYGLFHARTGYEYNPSIHHPDTIKLMYGITDVPEHVGEIIRPISSYPMADDEISRFKTSFERQVARAYYESLSDLRPHMVGLKISYLQTLDRFDFDYQRGAGYGFMEGNFQPISTRPEGGEVFTITSWHPESNKFKTTRGDLVVPLPLQISLIGESDPYTLIPKAES